MASSSPEPAAAPSKPNKSSQLWSDLLLHRRAYALTCVAAFGGMLFGWDTGLIGGVLTMPQFLHSFGLSKTSADYANLSGNIVSVLQGGCFFGAAASFYLSDKIGRKWSLLLADAIFLVGSVIQTTCALHGASSGAGNLGQLYAGRFIGGFGVGLISAVVPTYIGENAHKAVRGRCIGAMQLFNVAGIALAYFVNYGISKDVADETASVAWRAPFALQMLPGVLLGVGMLRMNESPRWLVEKGRLEDARKALASVREGDIDAELQEIVTDFEMRGEQLSLWQQMKAVTDGREMLYPALLAVLLMFWQQWTGTNSINYYSPQIFESIGLTSSGAGLFATGIYGVVKIVFTALALLLGVEQAGRKWSLIVGSLGQAFAMFYIGANEAVHPDDKSLSGTNTFAIVCVYLFVVFYSFGWGPIPFVLASECAPNHVRSLVMAAALMTNWLFNFVIAKLTPIMLANITYGTFLLFGAMCIIMTVFAVIFVPETRGVPLESVPLLFRGESLASVVKGATRDSMPRWSRARTLRHHHLGAEGEDGLDKLRDDEGVAGAKQDEEEARHVE